MDDSKTILKTTKYEVVQEADGSVVVYEYLPELSDFKLRAAYSTLEEFIDHTVDE